MVVGNPGHLLRCLLPSVPVEYWTYYRRREEMVEGSVALASPSCELCRRKCSREAGRSVPCITCVSTSFRFTSWRTNTNGLNITSDTP